MEELSNDPERVKIREELSHMSFEELQKLKERLGTKVYNQTVLGTKREKQTDFKRANRNRPREESSKRPVPIIKEIMPFKKREIRDPRYDSSCGEFNKKAFENAYSFLKDIKKQENLQLCKELRETNDPVRKREIKLIIQRFENIEREQKNKQKKLEKLEKEKEEQIASLREGKRPKFVKKSDRRVLDLVERYEELKQNGKLKKHIERKNKKHLSKDRKKYDLNKVNV